MDDAAVRIVDARDKRFYDGADAGQVRSGHIPNAVNIPYTSFVDSTGKFKDTSVLEALFSAEGIRRKDRIVTYCHVGHQATVVYVVARYLGYDASLYDGSFEEWSAVTEYPVVSPKPKNDGR